MVDQMDAGSFAGESVGQEGDLVFGHVRDKGRDRVHLAGGVVAKRRSLGASNQLKVRARHRKCANTHRCRRDCDRSLGSIGSRSVLAGNALFVSLEFRCRLWD